DSALVHELFAQQARSTPDAVALRGFGTSWSYARLLERSRAIAAFIQMNGGRPGGHVGIAMPRSLEMVAAMLGGLQAGCAYVPLDPAWPSKRLDRITRAIRPTLILDAAALQRIADGAPGTKIPVKLWPESPAYTLFTSGSTGVPKGVTIEHRNVTAL